jgi:surface antigen
MLHSEPTSRGLQIFPLVRLIPLVRRMTACAALCQALCACTMPLGGMVDSDPTGSISSVAAKVSTRLDFPTSLDEEDRRRALGALAIALDPQGNGATVHWDNPVNKAHGSVTPSGFAYPSNDLICRAFAAQFETVAGAEAGNGVACRDKDAQWSLSEFHTAKKS